MSIKRSLLDTTTEIRVMVKCIHIKMRLVKVLQVRVIIGGCNIPHRINNSDVSSGANKLSAIFRIAGRLTDILIPRRNYVIMLYPPKTTVAECVWCAIYKSKKVADRKNSIIKTVPGYDWPLGAD